MSNSKLSAKIAVFNHHSTNLWKLNKGALILVNVPSLVGLEQWPTVKIKNQILKYRGCTRAEAVDIFRRSYTSQSLFSSITDACSFISTLKTVLSSLKNLDKNKDIISIDLISFLFNFYTAIESRSFLTIAQVCLAFYALLKRMPLYTSYVAQSLESFVIAAASLGMPSFIIDVIKRMNVFSHEKILDDTTWVHTCLNTVGTFLVKTLTYLSIPLPESLKRLLNIILNWTSRHRLFAEAKSLIEESHKNINVITNPFFSRRVKDTYEAWSKCESLVEWSKASKFVETIYQSLFRLYKNVLSHEVLGRQEPVCFAFEGPPGVLKSYTMNAVVSSFSKIEGDLSYFHVVKPNKSGKDFYDTYNNETNLVMDDVGQQGISQFQPFINWISTTPCKLDCAEAKLKDTKTFNSERVLFTTNNIRNLHGLCRDDGISDITALWRRVMVFDFSQTYREHHRLLGKLRFHYFNTTTGTYEEDFPEDLKEEFRRSGIEVSPSFQIDPLADRTAYLAWFRTIILSMTKVKRSQISEADLSEWEIQKLQYGAQSNNIGDLLTGLSEWAWSLIMGASSYLASCSLTDYLILFGITGIVSALASLLQHRLEKALLPSTKWLSQGLQVLDRIVKTPHTAIQAISKQHFTIELTYSEGHKSHCHGLISGHYVIVPYHSIDPAGGMFMSASRYNNISYDKVPVNVKYANPENDVAILSLPLNRSSYERNLAANFVGSSRTTSLWFNTPQGAFDLVMNVDPRRASFKYQLPGGKESSATILASDFEYNYQEAGACGCLITNSIGKVVGMHVAGSAPINSGVAKAWSDSVLEEIYLILKSDVKFMSTVYRKDYISPEMTSFLKLELKGDSYASGNSNIVPSPLHNIVENTRSPADLKKYGPHTVKDVAKKSFVPVKDVSPEEVDFARQVLDLIIAPFKPITEREVVMGNESLAGINKNSSNGYHNEKDKTQYFDFVNGSFTPLLLTELDHFRNSVLDGTTDVLDWMWIETLKDEVRNNEKNGVPRSFRIPRVQLMVETKLLFGNMVTDIMANKWFNGILIGTNPFVDWSKIYSTMELSAGIWDGDVGSWDGSMLPQVQSMVNEVLLRKFEGSTVDTLMVEQLLHNLVNTPVMINDDVIVTTHSLPSGSYLTAIYNSLVHVCYIAMWFKRYATKPTPFNLFSRVFWYVYGDDSIVGIRDKEENLDAFSMEKFYTSIGLTYTDSHKHKISKAFSRLDEISFLKREFKFHPLIGRVMCPLSLRTLQSGLSWLDKTKDTQQVIQDKLNVFQRELYLHGFTTYESFKFLLEEAKKRGVDYTPLPESYILSVYKNVEECGSLKALSWGGTKYV